ncbi:MAG: carboxypeptidase-like regulatory domain-containing protein [Bacteroidota bacterium]
MKLPSLILTILCPLLTMCQLITISGKVITEDGLPVPGATITIKRSGQTTLTDMNGLFAFRPGHADGSLLTDTIVVSASGFQTESVLNNQRGSHTIILKQKITELDQVIIQAYGATTRRLNTGNITRVSADDIGRQPVGNPLAALQGLVPGLIVTQTSGVSGSGFNLQVRGRSSLDLSLTPATIHYLL